MAARKRLLYSLTAAVALILLGLFLALLGRDDSRQTFQTSTISCLAVSPDGTKLALGSYDVVEICSLPVDGSLSGIRLPTLGATAISLSPGGDRLAAVGDGYELWDLDTQKRVVRSPDEDFTYTDVVFTPDGQSFACSALTVDSNTHVFRGKIELVDTQSGVLRHSIEMSDTPYAIAYSPNGDAVVAGCSQSATLWDAVTGERLNSLDAAEAWQVAFVAGGRQVLTAGDNVAQLWDVSTGNQISTFHVGEFYQLAVSPEGNYCATANGSLKIWDVGSGTLVQHLRGHFWGAHAVVFAPDGETLISCGPSMQVRMLEAPRWGSAVKFWNAR